MATAETGKNGKPCQIGYGATHNNCFGIMAWDANGKRYAKRFPSKEASYAAFKDLWRRSYKTFPTRALAVKWTGNDRADSWLRNVTKYYNAK